MFNYNVTYLNTCKADFIELLRAERNNLNEQKRETCNT